jgi:transketolase
MLFNEMANAIRMLSVDAVEQAQSGHPGMPLGMADIATVLWQKFLKHNPKNPSWFNRDRFVLSNGHGSMLLYSLLHLTGYKLSIEEIKNFRQLHSLTPGHPEYLDTPGVETTTGPLGQGLANAVGMAIAEACLAAQCNSPEFQLVDHFTYAFVGDGCLMEGISHEVCSFAGYLGLGKLLVFYDDNGISIDGKVSQWFTDDTATRFKAYHWQIIGPIDGHDPKAIEQAILEARAEKNKPSLIICKTVIGYASQVAGSEQAHGAPLGAKGVAQVRQNLHWIYPAFEIPDHLYSGWDHKEQGQKEEDEWLTLCHHYQRQHPKEYHAFLRRINRDLPDNWEELTETFLKKCLSSDTPMATRKCSQHCIEFFANILPEMLGGSADLTASNNTDWSKTKAISKEDYSGNYLYYGVREFGMAAIMNGLALHGGFIPYGGTFLVFADYARNAIRLSALMQQRVIYIFTHDSIGLGEDGPTHQPVEQAAMLRLTPNMQVWRPADLVETAVAWSQALEHKTGPSCLLLSRQSLPALKHSAQTVALISKGAYILSDCIGQPEVILIATGSEVQLALTAAAQINAEGGRARVVSMPCCERFIEQDVEYQEKVLPTSVSKRIAIEASAKGFWYRFVGLKGAVIGLDRFGVSAPAKDAFSYFGFTVDNILKCVKNLEK